MENIKLCKVKNTGKMVFVQMQMEVCDNWYRILPISCKLQNFMLLF